MAETSGSSTSSSTTTVVQEDDGRTGYARLIGILLLIAPFLLIYPLIALWPRAQGSPPTLCAWQKELQGSATGTGQAERTQTASGQTREEPPASSETAPESTPPAADATPPTAQPAGATDTPETGAADGAAGAPATPTAAAVARELKRLQDEEKKEQWVPCARIRPFTGEFPLSPDVRLLLLVLLAGALGAYVHAAQSYAGYIGNRKFMKQWTWWYVLRIPVGAALALFVYFVARGGLLTGTTPPSETDDLNIFGIMAFAALAGLFSKQVIDKLAEVFSNFFRSEQDAQRKDKMEDKSTEGGATTTTTTQGGAAGGATTTTAQGGGAGGAASTTTTTTPGGGTGGATGGTGGAAG